MCPCFFRWYKWPFARCLLGTTTCKWVFAGLLAGLFDYQEKHPYINDINNCLLKHQNDTIGHMLAQFL